MHRKDKYSEHCSIIWSLWQYGGVSVEEIIRSGFEFTCSHFTFRFRASFQQGVPWNSGNYRVWIHSERPTWHHKNISQMNCDDNYSEHSSIVRSVWPNGWVFIYELRGCGFVSSYSHFTFRFRPCFEQGVPWHSGNCRVWIHSEMRTWHDKNIQSNAPYR